MMDASGFPKNRVTTGGQTRSLKKKETITSREDILPLETLYLVTLHPAQQKKDVMQAMAWALPNKPYISIMLPPFNGMAGWKQASADWIMQMKQQSLHSEKKW